MKFDFLYDTSGLTYHVDIRFRYQHIDNRRNIVYNIIINFGTSSFIFISTDYISKNAYKYRLMIKLFTKRWLVYTWLQIYTFNIMKEFQMSANVDIVAEWPIFVMCFE